MIFNFKTEADSEQYVLDTEELTWARSSSIAAAPSVAAATSNLARFVPIEEGRLIPLGGGRYALEGRNIHKQPPELAYVVILTVLSGQGENNGGTCITFIQGNVPIKDGSFQHQIIKNFYCKVQNPVPAAN